MTAALTAFNDGIRSYYFALAGLAWLGGALPLTIASTMLTALLVWRQTVSPVSGLFHRAAALTDAAHARLKQD
jgi:uncharacterized membrane protein